MKLTRYQRRAMAIFSMFQKVRAHKTYKVFGVAIHLTDRMMLRLEDLRLIERVPSYYDPQPPRHPLYMPTDFGEMYIHREFKKR